MKTSQRLRDCGVGEMGVTVWGWVSGDVRERAGQVNGARLGTWSVSVTFDFG